jgi:acyl dehydratase
MEQATGGVGRTFAPHAFTVTRERIVEYARATGETNPVHFDVDAARAAGHPDLVAPPMFAVVYCASAIEEALLDPGIGIDFEMLVHGGQGLEWGPLVLASDEISTTIRFADLSERLGMSFYAFESTSLNQRGEEVCRGRWTQIVRPRT